MMSMATMSSSAAKTEEIRRGAEALVCCAICTDTFKHPKVLPCQHTFCLLCLRQFYESCNQQRVVKLSNFPCPECRGVTYVPSGGLEAFPNDFKINQIQDFLDKLQFPAEGDDNVTCDVCKYEERVQAASSYCVQCSKNLCAKCEGHHANTALFRSHSTVPVGTSSRGGASSMTCSAHNEDIRYYCTRCSAPACTVCALSAHSNHDLIDIDAALGQQRDSLKRHLAEARGKLAEHELALDEIAKVKQDQTRDLERVRNAVRNHVIAVVNCIREQEADLLDKLQDSYHDHLQQLDTLETRTEAVMRSAGELCERAAQSMEPGASVSLLLEEHGALVDQLSEEAAREPLSIPAHLRQGTTFMPNSGFEIGTVTWESDDEGVGSLRKSDVKMRTSTTSTSTSSSTPLLLTSHHSNGATRPTTSDLGIRSVDSFQLYKPPSNLSDESDFHDNNNLSSSYGNVSVKRRDSYAEAQNSAQESPGVKYSIHLSWKAQYFYDNKDVAFMPDGCLTATDYKNGGDRIKIYDTSGNLRHWVQGNSRAIIKPWGIAMNHLTNHLIITDHGDQAVKVLDTNLDVVHVWRNRFSKPCGVAVTKSGKVVVSDVGSRRFKLSIYTPTGVRTREFAAHGDELSNLLSPNYITVDQHDRILVADCENHCVKAYDHQGNSLLQFGSTSSQHGQGMYPQGIWVDSANNILVVDQNSGCISMFSSSGNFIQQVGQLEGTSWGLAGFQDKYMAVTKEQSLEVFEMSK